MQCTPIVMLAVATVLGTLAVAPLSPEARLLTAAAIAAVGIGAAVWRFESPQFRVVLVGVLALSATNAWLHERSHRIVAETRTTRFTATVLAAEHGVGNPPTYTLALESGLIATATFAQKAAIGDCVVVRGRLEPFDDPRNPGEPSERLLQGERGLDARIESAALISRARAGGFDLRVAIARLHFAALERFREQLGEPAASILAGELWGERSALPPDLRADFQESGTVHVLVTAGLHVGLIAALITVLLSCFPLGRPLSTAVAVAVVWLFVIWSGLQLPAVRAATMATAALTARACGAASLSWNALSLAAIAIAFTRPESVATPSFALSFACIAAIFAWASPIEVWLVEHVALPARLREALTLTLATQLGTWPITAAIFLQFSPYAVAANLAIVPCVPLTMTLGIAELATQWCLPLAQAFANLNGWIIAWIVGVIRTIGVLPASSVPMTPAPVWCIAFYIGALLVLPHAARRSGSTLGLATLILATSLVLWPPVHRDRLLRITVLDVGQADGIVIQTPAGYVIEVDAGGRLERGGNGANSDAEAVGERTVVPFLLRQGIHRIDAFELSHPHGDHAGGCAPVLRKLRVTEIADSGQTYGGHAYHDCLDTARADGVPVVYPRAGAVWQTNDGVTLHFIGPELPFIGGKNAINDNSVAFILQYRSFRMLFTGDAGVAAEQRFLAEGIDLHADVVTAVGVGLAPLMRLWIVEVERESRERGLAVAGGDLFHQGSPVPDLSHGDRSGQVDP